MPDALATHARRTRDDLRLVIESPDGTRISLASASSEWGRVETLIRALFVFTNRARTAVQILAYEGSGFWLCHKRFSKGRLRSWLEPGQEALLPMQAQELSVFLYNGAPAGAHVPEPWRPVGAALAEAARASPTS